MLHDCLLVMLAIFALLLLVQHNREDIIGKLGELENHVAEFFFGLVAKYVACKLQLASKRLREAFNSPQSGDW